MKTSVSPLRPRLAENARWIHARGGVYIGGGIAPKILPALQSGLFIDAFRDKEPMTHMLRTLPVHVILNSAAGLLGAAVRASTLHAV